MRCILDDQRGTGWRKRIDLYDMKVAKAGKKVYNLMKNTDEEDIMIEERTVGESRVETVHIVRPNHLNAAGRLFGGILMQWIDEVAGIVAMRHTRCNCTTASVDNLRFIRGAYQQDLLVIIGKVTYVGTTSMEVRVDTYIEDTEGMRRPINRAYFTMVALDENDKPCPVPKLLLESEEEKQNGKQQRNGEICVKSEKKRDSENEFRLLSADKGA